METAPTYDLAEKALTRLQSQVDEDKQPKSKITVRQAIEQWLDVVVLEETTRERYEDLIHGLSEMKDRMAPIEYEDDGCPLLGRRHIVIRRPCDLLVC